MSGGQSVRPPLSRAVVQAGRAVRRVCRLDRLPVWVGRLVWLLGLVSVLSALVPALRDRLGFVRELLPAFVPAVATAATIATGLALMAVAGGLRRRKREAWWSAVALSSTSTLLHLVKALDIEEAALSAVILVVLLSTRRHFVATSDPQRRWRTVAQVIGIPVMAVALGTAYLLLRHRQFSTTARLADLVVEAAAGLVGINGPLAFRDAPAADRAAVVLGTLGLLSLVAIVVTLLRPRPAPPGPSAMDEPRLRSLIARAACPDSLAYFALRPDKSLTFSPSGKAAVAYRVVGGVSLAAGDPIGDPEAWPGAISAWLTEAQEHAWIPAVLAASERGATVYARHGLDAFELGDEAVLDVAGFSLEGRDMRTVRQAVNCIARTGATAAITRTGDTPRRCSRRRAGPRQGGATARANAASRWRWVASETPPIRAA